MHRNTYLFVSILAVFAALVVGVNVGKKIQPITASPTPLAKPDPAVQNNTFINTPCGISLTYPDTLILTDSGSGSAMLRSNATTSGTIVMTCQADIPRIPLPPEKIETMNIVGSNGSSVTASLYHDASAKDGTPVDALIFTHPRTLLDFFIAGFGPDFNSVISSLRLLP